ncbi:N-acetylneuraminate synthase [Thalassotalea sp. LPB0316]|uniref:N-acetylneuraminate synthase n=1 Tax=Thalassotalea sp. LPB0316 TaxID=2769490 RepID=UPI0018669473|nr:N-acetylneuraminate synthase [Thalassotalea sp. LPB0316]QOL27082.1 N-acetylneuraminate synthase [Thalassotalea sp. LPB0316]
MTLIIAEAGVNHNGDENIALALVEAAHRAGADIVKFQTFKAKHLVTAQAQQASYQVKNTQKQESQLAMLERLELSYQAHVRLKQRCSELGIEFLSTAFDLESLDFLVHDLGIERLKIPSGELTNSPLVLAHAQAGCQLIVSTGMATLDEIKQCLSVIAFGLLHKTQTAPTEQQLLNAYNSEQGQALLQQYVTVLHCTTEYPAPFNEINLKAMVSMARDLKLPVGYSDHSEGFVVPIAATALGAQIIEKHFTLDKQMPGPDHKASIEPEELTAMVQAIKQTNQSLGDGIKQPQPSEWANIAVARKSLVAKTAIQQGECFNEHNLEIKRPGSGVSPTKYWQYLGRAANKTYQAGDLIAE